MLARANALKENPEFYNTLTNTCTTNIVDHINARSPNRVSWDMRVLLPIDSDELAYELGFIDTSVPFDTLRAQHLINPYVVEFIDDPAFSQKIRKAQREAINTGLTQ
jgi:hypothetical protein